MRKLIILIICFFLFTGCTNINKQPIDDIVIEVLNSNIDLNNQYRTGYKYYLPRGLRITDNKEYNERLKSKNDSYYLYVDIVSYYNKIKEDYFINKDAYFSNAYNYNDMYGYLEINKIENKYLIEMMYNYAKIEVIVDEIDIDNAVFNAITILSSIQFNDSIINNMMGEQILEFNETEINIFETKKSESNILKYDEEYGNYEKENEQ